jgi:UDP-N-acetylglucosamine transferase subunit ALG13
MIFATLGTSPIPFDRLLLALDELALDEPLVLQHGASAIRPAGATCLGFMSYDETVGYIRRARAVVAHGGVGTIITAMANGHKPIVMPRLRRLGEAVDDHQSALAERLHRSGLVTAVDDTAGLGAALAERGERVAAAGGPAGGRLVADLRAYIEAAVAG